MAWPNLSLASLSLILASPGLTQPTHDVLQGVPAEANNLVVVRDVLPHIEAFLRSPRLRDLFRDIWTRTEGAHWAAMVDDLAALARRLSSPEAEALRSALGIDGDFYEQNRDLLEALAQGLRRIGAIESRDSLENGIYREHFTLRWAQ